MKYINKLLEDFRIFKIDDEEEDDDMFPNPFELDDMENDEDGLDDMRNGAGEFDDMDNGEDEFADMENDDGDDWTKDFRAKYGSDEESEESDGEFDDMDDDMDDEDPDFQGIIRNVKGANMVYKRNTNDGDFEELWVYNVGDDMKHTNNVKRAILAGTDIEPGKTSSDDGTQTMELFSMGNVQYLHINGLPN